MKVFMGITTSAFLMLSLMECSFQPKPEVRNLHNQLEAELKTELESNSFTNKVALAYESAHIIGRSPIYFFTTLMYPDGTIQYKGGTLVDLLLGADNFDIHRILNFPVGTFFRVNKIKMREDSVELDLVNTTDKNKKATLRFVLGKGYETEFEFESVMIAISQGLSVDYQRFERIMSLKGQYNRFKSQLQTAVRSIERIQYAQQLSKILEEILADMKPSDKRSPKYLEYQKEEIELKTLIQTLQPQAQQERLVEIREILRREAEEEKQIKQDLQAKPADLKRMEEQINLLLRWEAILKHRQQLFQEMASQEVSLSAEETNRLGEDLHELEIAQKEATKYKNKLKTQQLEDEFQSMKQRRLKLYDAYSQVFGSPQEKNAKASLLDHLQRMYENRRSAE
jgi:hypothetical protein